MKMSYIEIVKTGKKDYEGEGIRLVLTEEGREELGTYRVPGSDPAEWVEGTDNILVKLLEDHLCNGWEFVAPEDLGALTDAPILSDEVERDEDGNVTKVGTVYWFPDYAIRCELDELLEKGEVFFPAAQEEVEANG